MAAAIFAFFHHLAAFTLVAGVVVEFVLIRGEIGIANARKLLRTDAVVGVAAGLLLIVGLLRVFYFEKGATYYFHSGTFLAKLTLFVLIALLSIYPTKVFLSWRNALNEGRAPDSNEQQRRRLRTVLHCELAAIVVLILCAALMARGIGFIG